MRPKVVIVIVLLAAGFLAAAFMLSKMSRPQPENAPVETAATQPVAAPIKHESIPLPAVSLAPAVNTTSETMTNPAAPEREDRDQFVVRRTGELNDLAMQTNSEAHQQILDELKNPDREIRQAALAALEQANDRSVIPQMQQIADQTDDSGDKAAIQDAIDFIKLPSLTEYMEQQNGQKAEK